MDSKEGLVIYSGRLFFFIDSIQESRRILKLFVLKGFIYWIRE
jgi:hypothetical protein